MEKTVDEPKLAIIPNVGASDVFADHIVGAFLTNGNVHMTFAARRCDYSVQPNVFVDAVIGRLVMPMVAVENMIEFLSGFVARMKEQPAHISGDAPNTLQ